MNLDLIFTSTESLSIYHSLLLTLLATNLFKKSKEGSFSSFWW